MTLIRNFTLGLLLLSSSASAGFAQDRTDTRASSLPATTVTISTSVRGIRVAALGGVRQMRLEVLGAGGDSLYSSGFQPGSVRDWNLEDAHGQRLPDGSYQCLVTFRDLAGRVGTKQGTVLVQGGQPSLQLSEAEQPGAVEPERRLSPMVSDEAPAITLTAHDGADGQLVTTRGGLAFRAGDFFSGKDQELMRLTPEGNLGIGTTNPQAKLDVAGVIRARDGIQFEDGTVLTSARGVKKVSGGLAWAPVAGDTTTANIAGTGTLNRLPKWLDAAGTLGDSAITETNGLTIFGRTTPLLPDAANYHLVEMVAPGTKTPLVLVGGSGSMEFWKDTDGSGGSPSAAMSFGMAVPGTAASSDIVFSTYRAGGGWAERLRVTQAGNVGVGVSAPTVKLDVAGSIRVSGDAVVAGNIAAKYQDVAEWVPARGRMAAGTVVVLDAASTNTVAPSRRAYDTHVAGVVSAQPGLILGEGGEGKALVATTGRVKVRVDARRGAIRVGDLLVTSGREGVAMRSRPLRVGGARIHRPGTIIGKALEPLANGEGEILVLLSLQ